MSQNKIQYLEDLIAEDGRDAFPYFALAKEYEKIGEKEKASFNYKKLISTFPSYSGTYYHYAQFLITNEKTDLAKDIITTGLEVLKSQKENHLYNELSGLYLQFFEEDI
ncbi:hypothetical protein [Membranihabitans maritimus]|uniref:hypothetical protein n=1 Tax=Membranihabitans maritimus TaxID=2904244 RepID=UPI001F20B730|nr:hypothetical protein [Membranihabitans maritimus]